MKKNRTIFSSIIASLICFTLLISCNNEIETEQHETGNLELDKFFKSNTYTEFSNNFNADISNFQFNKMETTTFDAKGLNIFTMPIVKNGIKIGQIAICSKNKGTTFKVLYEDWSQFDLSTGGDIKIFTSNKVFIANWKAIKLGNNFSMKISETGFRAAVRVKSNNTETTGETYAECVTRVYKTAKDACDASPTCKMACDAADLLGGQCTISMMAAAAAACAIYG